MNLNRELEELQESLQESERVRKTQSAELDELVSSKDDVGKSVSADSCASHCLYGGWVLNAARIRN